jgi:hypothetical protein
VTASTQYTAVFVGATDNTSGARYAFANGNVDTIANGFGLAQSSLGPRLIFHAGAVSPADGNVILSAREAWVARYGAANSFRLNGASELLSTTTSSPLTPSGRFQIGGREATDRSWFGPIQAVLVFDRELTVTECEAIEAWIEFRHGISM